MKNQTSYKQVFQSFLRPGEVCEVRAIGLTGKGPWQGWAKGTVSGYFNDPAKFEQAVTSLENLKKAGAIYMTLNPVNPSLLARADNRLKAPPKATTSDTQVTCHRCLLVDTDPTRPTDISASQEEIDAAMSRRDEIIGWLAENGFPAPCKAFSGNGGHAVYWLEDLPNSEEITGLKRDALKALSERFSKNGVTVDEAVFNPSRIVKLYGTTARKGDSTADRPHRQSYVEEVPDPLIPVTREQLKWLADQAPKENKQRPKLKVVKNGGSLGPLDVAAYLDHYGLNYKVKAEPNRSVYGLLDGCLFNPDHTANESSIIQTKDGALYYQCFHNGCKDARRTWRDAREKISSNDSLAQFCEGYDPTAKQRKSTKREDPADHSFYRLTDLGNAERFADQWRESTRYCHQWGAWLIYNSQTGVWDSDCTNKIRGKAKTTVRNILDEAKEAKGKEYERIISHALRSEAEARIKAMLSLAQSEPGVSVLPEELDADPWLFNSRNGTLDLRSGELLKHDRHHLMTKFTPVRFDPSAECPLFDTYLAQVMNGNKNLISFLQRVVGYSLTGDTREQCLFFLHGKGANGKTTFIETTRALLGSYAKQTDFDTFLDKKYDGVRNDIARLKGARHVSAVEVGDGKRLAEVLIKQVTGQDTIAARFLFREFFEFKPEFKIFLAANHKPIIRGTDVAIWRRIFLIPFEVTIPEQEQDADLSQKLREELPGILAWAVRGCLRWQEKGLQVPDEVRAATQKYKDEMDPLAGFLADRCLVDKSNARLKASMADLYKEYETWCQENGDEPLKKNWFSRKLSEYGLPIRRTTGARYRIGIGLLSENGGQAPEAESRPDKEEPIDQWEVL